MAKKKDKEEDSKDKTEKIIDSQELANAIIKELNKDSDTKIAWNLASDADNPTEVKEFISTGSTLLDYIVANKRNGGVPVGKITEISGEEASGKSLIAGHLIANTQKKGGIAIYLDTENAANKDFMRRVGVDLEKLVYLQPGTIEEVGETIQKTIIMARAKAPDKIVLIIWDSVAGTPSVAEIEGDFNPNDRIGVTAKAISKMMKKLTQTVGRENIALVFTNQLRMKIGVMYGDALTTPGGKAIPYHASVRIRLTKSTQIQDDKQKDEARGKTFAMNTLAKTVKCRLGPPLRKCEFEINFAFGVDDEKSWFEYLHGVGEIEKAGGMCYLTSFTSGPKDEEEDDKDAKKSKKVGFKFRESKWTERLNAIPELKEHVLNLLEKHLVIKYDGHEIADQELDTDNMMEMEQVAEDLK